MKKTQLDLWKSYTAAALAALALDDRFEIDKLAMETFTNEKNDPADWDFWNRGFESNRREFRMLDKAPAPSAAPPKKATITAPLPKPGVVPVVKQ